MNKSRKKKNNYNEEAMAVLQERYGYSLDFIRKSLRGDRVGIMPDVLKKEYRALVQSAKIAIDIRAKNL